MNISHELAGGPYRHIGAARVSLFFALWTGALFALQELRVEAAPVLHSNATVATPWWTPPASPPTIETREFWRQIENHSDVMNGTWRGGEPDVVAAEPLPTSVDTHAAVQAADEVIEAVVETVDMVATAVRHPASVEVTPIANLAIERERVELVRVERQEREDVGRTAKREARAAIERGDDENAYRILSAVERRSVPDQQHYDLLAAVMVRTARFSEAADVYAALITGDASDPRLWAGYAMALEHIGQSEPSQLAYRNVLRTAIAGTPLHELARARLQHIG